MVFEFHCEFFVPYFGFWMIDYPTVSPPTEIKFKALNRFLEVGHTLEAKDLLYEELC